MEGNGPEATATGGAGGDPDATATTTNTSDPSDPTDVLGGGSGFFPPISESVSGGDTTAPMPPATGVSGAAPTTSDGSGPTAPTDVPGTPVSGSDPVASATDAPGATPTVGGGSDPGIPSATGGANLGGDPSSDPSGGSGDPTDSDDPRFASLTLSPASSGITSPSAVLPTVASPPASQATLSASVSAPPPGLTPAPINQATTTVGGIGVIGASMIPISAVLQP